MDRRSKAQTKKNKDFFESLVKYFPNLPKKLIIANIGISPSNYLKKSFMMGILNSLFISAILIFFLIKSRVSLIWILPIFLVGFFGFFNLNILKVDSLIYKRRKAIDKDVVFAGRYMLLKLYSGTPLLNALIEQSRGEGMTSKYVKEIVDDINSGSSIEDSLDKAMEYCPSEKFRKILFYMSNALKYGVDVTGPLESAISQIIEENFIEVQKYGKKMNTFMIFYMLLGVVLPSLGITIFIVLAGFIGISIGKNALFTINFLILILQVIFLFLVRGRIPSVDV